MKSIKRFFAVFLCGVMLVSSTAVPIYAETAPEELGHVHEDEVPAEPGPEPFEGDLASPAEEPGEPSTDDEPSPGPADESSKPMITVYSAQGGLKDVFCLAPDSSSRYPNTVSVTVSDPDGLSEVTIGGKKVTIPSDNNKTITVTITASYIPADNKMAITAKDSSGNEAAYTVTVYAKHKSTPVRLFNEANCNTFGFNNQAAYYCEQCHGMDISMAMRPTSYAKGHSFEEYNRGMVIKPDAEFTEVTPCGTETQVKKYVCDTCGYAVMEENADLGEDSAHKWELKYVAPDKTKGGYRLYECADCHAVKDCASISQLCHMATIKVTKDPNCVTQENGVRSYICITCGEVVATDSLAWQHKMSPWETVKPADCVSNTPGLRQRHCTVEGCNYVESQEISSQHSWLISYTVDKAPTCVEPGVKSRHCSKCGAIMPGSEETIPATGSHNYVDHDSNCTTQKQCSSCGAPDPEDVPRTSHNLMEMKNLTHHWKDCTYPGCDYKEDEEEHTYGPYTVVNDLHHRRYCTVCGQQNSFWHTAEQKLDDGNCLTPIKCEECGYVFTPGKNGHSFDSGIWISDETHHWNTCRNTGCNVKVSYGEHRADTDSDCTQGIYCYVCKREIVSPTPEHTWSAWVLNSEKTMYTRHCTVDGCSVVETADHKHTFSNWTSTDGKTHSRACTECGFEETGTCNVSPDNSCLTATTCDTCGYIIEEAQSSHNMVWHDNGDGTHTGHCQNTGCHEEISGQHTFGEWTTTGTAHTRVCSLCGLTESGEHESNEDGDCSTEALCTVCNRVLTEAQPQHIYTDWTSDPEDYYYHYRTCTNPGCTHRETAAHSGTDDGDCSTGLECDVCGMMYIAPEPHHPDGEFFSDASGHYQYCSHPGCTKTVTYPHMLVNDGDSDCTTPTYCSVCGYVAVEGSGGHNWSNWEATADGTGHHKRCLNENCSAATSAEGHSGAATCAGPAVCGECGLEYGGKDPTNHTGGTEVRGYLEPTEDSEGYTGDTYCLGCETVIEKGKSIPATPHSTHNFGSAWHTDSLHHWKECVKCGTRNEEGEHVFGSLYSDAAGHFKVCTVCGYVERHDHSPAADDNDCTTPTLCTECGYAVVEAKETHDFSGGAVGDQEGHRYICQNPDCTVKSGVEEHSGGSATCFTLAVCQVCGSAYGELDSSNHVGGQVVLGYRDPTDLDEGYTGDGYCLSCGAVLLTGRAIPTGEREHPETEIEYDENHCWKSCTHCGMRESGSYQVHSYLSVSFSGAMIAYSTASDVETCTNCGNVNPYSGHEHNFSAPEVRLQPTCGDAGMTVMTCSICGANFAEEIASTGEHNWDGGVNVKYPNCIEDGEILHTCTVCGEHRREIVPSDPQAHTWDEGTVITPALGETDGEMLFTCLVCGDTHTAVIPATGEHTWGQGVVTKAADCTNTGIMTYTCEVCGTEKTEVIPVDLDAHVYGQWMSDPDDYVNHYRLCKYDTCRHRDTAPHSGHDDGNCETPVFCQDCGFEFVRAKSHSPAGQWYWDDETHYQHCENLDHDGNPCTGTVGYAHIPVTDDDSCLTGVHCQQTGCGYVFYEGQSQHNWSAWEPTADGTGHTRHCLNESCKATETETHTGGTATCTDSAVCAQCNAHYGEPDPANHAYPTELRDYKAPTDWEPGYSGDLYCTGCGALVEAGHELPPVDHQHVYSEEWSSDGTNHWHQCTVCGAIDEGSVTAHTFGEWTADAEGHAHSCTVCGHEEKYLHSAGDDDGNCTTGVLCEVCQYVLVAPMEHDFGGIPIGTPSGHYHLCQNPGCTAKGELESHTGGTATCYAKAMCSVCAVAYGGLDPENHAGGEIVIGYMDATVTEPGYTGDVICLGCGAVLSKGQEIPAGEREHDYVWDHDGQNHWRDCSRCGQRLEESFGPHSYGDDGICTVCGASDPFFGHTHTWSGYTVDEEPTCVETGLAHRNCSLCSAHEVVYIPATGKHVFKDGRCTMCGILEPSDLPQSPETYDRFPGIALLSASALLAGGLGLVLVSRRRRRSR